MIIPRAQWKPRYGTGHLAPRAQIRAVFHHAPERPLPANPTREQVASQIRIIEDWHATTLTPGNPRIGYNFIVVVQTGEVWEGLGWGRVGAHVGGHNTASVGILLLGLDGSLEAGSDKVWRSISRLIRQGIDQGHLSTQLELAPHNRYRATSCPGGVLERYVSTLTLAGLLGLDSEHTPPRMVWSNFFNDHLIVTRYVSDEEWYFVPLSLAKLGQRRAHTRLSEMPVGDPSA